MSIKIVSCHLVIILFLFSCDNQESAEQIKSFAERIETAHNKESFQSHDIVEFDLLLKFGGRERLNGTLTLTTDSQNGIISELNSDQLYYSGDKVFYKNRDSINTEKIRFKSFTWSYFFLYPYKLTDPGVIWNEYTNNELGGKHYQTSKMTFESGIGDSPDDWYIAYADSSSNLLHAAAYIVTYTKSQGEAEEDPHAIVYHDYKEVDGVPIAHEWTFWEWRDGKLTKQLGEATLSNVKFLQMNERSFEVPTDYVEI